MNAKNLVAYFLSLVLLAAVPAQGQIIPRSGGGGGGGGGGGDASAANQATQIGALPLEDVLHVTGDRGSFSLGVENDDQAILSTGDKAYTPFGITARGQVINIPMHTTSIPDTNQISKQDSAAHINTDVGVPAMSLANEGQTQLSTSDNQYQMTAADREGNQSVIALHSLGPYAAGRQVSHLEDDAHGSGDAGFPSWGVIHTGLGTVGAIGDYAQHSLDLAGRQYNIPMTTPNTSITFQLGKTEDVASSAGDTGVPAMQVRRDTLIADASVSADGDFLHGFTDNRGARWTHNDPVDAQLDFHVAASVTAVGTAIDVSGANTVLIHATTDATWNRTATLDFEAALGGGPLSAVRTVPHIAWQDPTCASDQPPTARFANPAIPTPADNQCGYLVDVRGFQTLRVNMTVVGGTTGTISIHGHVVKNGDGLFKMMSQTNYATDLAGVPDFGTLIVGLSPAGIGGTAAALPIARASSTLYADTDRGVPIHGINNEDVSTIAAIEGEYSPFAVDDAARQIMILSHNEAMASSARATHLEDNGHTTGDAGVFALAMRNSTPTPTATTALNLDYSPIGVSNLTQVLTVLHHNSAYLGTINISKQEDVGHASTDAGIPAWAVRNDDRATVLTTATGDYSGIAVTDRGEVWTAHSGAAFFAITDTGIAAVSQNFSFGFTSKKVFISAPTSNADGVCIDHAGGTAVCPAGDTAGDDVLEPGESISIDEHAITSVSAISVSGTNTIVVRAFN